MRKSKKGNALYGEFGIWYDETGDQIYISLQENPGFITTVSRNPTSKRGNPNLFGYLDKELRKAGIVPPPEQ